MGQLGGYCAAERTDVQDLRTSMAGRFSTNTDSEATKKQNLGTTSWVEKDTTEKTCVLGVFLASLSAGC